MKVIRWIRSVYDRSFRGKKCLVSGNPVIYYYSYQPYSFGPSLKNVETSEIFFYFKGILNDFHAFPLEKKNLKIKLPT